MDHFRAISIFVSAAELGSFHQAAIQQGMTPQAVSKSIGQLERHLGVRLFHRTTRRIGLTAEGRLLLDRVRPQLAGLVETLGEVRSAADIAEGQVRVTAAGPVARKVLMPLIQRFMERHRRITLELVVDDLFTDSVSQKIDVGFRAGSQPTAQVVARQLFAFQHVICASPAYLQRHGVPRRWTDLRQHHCTGFRQPIDGKLAEWLTGAADAGRMHALDAVFCSNETETELEAVLAGIGIGQIDTINAAAHIRSGRLVPLLLDHVIDGHGLHLYYPQRQRIPARVRLFIDFAIETLCDSGQYRLSREELECANRD